MAEEDLIYVPGAWFCPNCPFRLQKNTIFAQTGEIGVNRDATSEACPNDGTTMQKVTWKKDAIESNEFVGKLMKENRELRDQLESLTVAELTH